MRYFTRERYLAMQQVHKDAMDAADADWEQAVEDYDAYLQTIRADLPETVRQLLDGFFLHDARVLSMGQRADTFVISLQLDVPPNELLTIAYTLVGSLELKKETFPWVKDTYPVDWLYEEVELIHDGDRNHFVHAILFSNGWELQVPFREVHTTTAFPLLPHQRSLKTGEPPMPASQSA